MAIDSCEPQVRQALKKAGWIIDPKPYVIETEDRTGYIDIQASKRMENISAYC